MFSVKGCRYGVREDRRFYSPLLFLSPYINFDHILHLMLQVTMSGDWVPWSAKVPQVEVETHKVASPDVVVPTLDTVVSNA